MEKIACFSKDHFQTVQLSREKIFSPFFPQDHALLSEVEETSKLLRSSKITGKNTETFWCSVHNYQDASGPNVIKLFCP
jgi:hypothetical protein